MYLEGEPSMSLFDRVEWLTQQLIELQEKGKEPVQPSQPSLVVVIPPSTSIADHGQLFSAFRKLKIPVFTRAGTPDDTKNWILRLEKNFEAMAY